MFIHDFYFRVEHPGFWIAAGIVTMVVAVFAIRRHHRRRHPPTA